MTKPVKYEEWKEMYLHVQQYRSTLTQAQIDLFASAGVDLADYYQGLKRNEEILQGMTERLTPNDEAKAALFKLSNT